MDLNPKYAFYIGLAVTIATAVGGGTVNLSHAIPADWIPTVQAWNNLVALCGTAYLTLAHAFSSGDKGPLAK